MSLNPDAISVAPAAARPVTLRQRLAAHLQITRLDHSIKQVFILPGIVLAVALAGEPLSLDLLGRIVIGFVAVHSSPAPITS